MKYRAINQAIRLPVALLTNKAILAMKITFFLFFIALTQATASVYGQISLNAKDAPLEMVLKSIEKQTGYTFFYDILDVKDVKVNIIMENASLDQVLRICFKNLPISYKIISNNVVLKKKKEFQNDNIAEVFGIIQNITGVVNDEKGPLAGVSVTVKGSDRATLTNAAGEFVLNGVHENDILIFSSVGYETKEFAVKGNMISINVKLKKHVTSMNDVVIIGYGTVERKDLTGSVSVIPGKEIENVPFLSVDNAMAGKAAGVQVIKTDGTPGGAVRIRVRGSSSILGGNDPLYVIDGVPIQIQSNYRSPGYDISSPIANDINSSAGLNSGLSTSFINGLNNLNGLNTDDIESITVLKDASSTAIYGSKAANGVVIITTKRGKKDMKPLITASYYGTFSIPFTPHVLNSEQYKLLITEAAQNDKNARYAAGDSSLPGNTDAILNSPSTFFGTANTNWIKKVTSTTYSNNVELSVQGGSSTSKYFTSISYNNTPGVVENTDYQRISGKLNLENEIGSRFRFITNLLMGYVNQNIGDGAYDQALKSRPDYLPYDSLGNPINFSNVGPSYLGFQNPVGLLQAINNAKTFNLLGSLSAIYNITKELTFKSTLSLNSQTYNQRNYTPSFLQIGSSYGNITNETGIGSNSNSRLTNWIIENTLTYNKQINNNNFLNVLMGQSYETRKTSFFSATAAGYPNDNILNSLSSGVTPILITGDDPSKPQSYLLSFYLRANYSLMDKYLFTFTGRADGSSKLATDNKFAYFPSGAIAWRISRENFLKNIKWVDDIKFRGSYGLTGTQNIGDQMYRTLYSPFSYAGSSSLVPTQLGNNDIRWETTKEADAGLDIALFNERLSVTFDFYNRLTDGALLSLPIAPSSSYSSVLGNTVNLKNTGYELTIGGDIIRMQNFRWDASINITWNKSIVTKLNSSADLNQINSLTGTEYGNTTLMEGKPLGLLTGLTFKGLIKTQDQLEKYKEQLGGSADFYPYLAIGAPMFELEDIGGGYFYPNFNTIIGNAAPNYYGGMSQGFTYKNFRLQLYFTFSQGGSLMWGDHISSIEFSGSSNANVVMLKRFTPTNTNTNQPALILNNDNGGYFRSQLDVFNSSYIKLRTLTFNYNMNKYKWMSQAGLSSVELFASATNLFTITKYPGNDPETSNDPFSVQGGYIDVSNYPTVKTFSIGLKASF